MIATAPDYSTFPACATEDAAGPCYWDAATQGNGTGQSFAVLEDGTLVPVGEYVTAPIAEPTPALDSPGESAPIEGRTDTVYVPETGQVVQETTGEVIDQLAVTGADDFSPAVLVVGLALVVVGILTARRARRA